MEGVPVKIYNIKHDGLPNCWQDIDHLDVLLIDDLSVNDSTLEFLIKRGFKELQHKDVTIKVVYKDISNDREVNITL